jgi:hypothetical protein
MIKKICEHAQAQHRTENGLSCGYSCTAYKAQHEKGYVATVALHIIQYAKWLQNTKWRHMAPIALRIRRNKVTWLQSHSAPAVKVVSCVRLLHLHYMQYNSINDMVTKHNMLLHCVALRTCCRSRFLRSSAVTVSSSSSSRNQPLSPSGSSARSDKTPIAIGAATVKNVNS